MDEVSSTWHKKQIRRWKEFMETLGDAFIQVRICIAKMIPAGLLNSLSFGSIFMRDRMVGNKSSFKRKKADRALGVASNC